MQGNRGEAGTGLGKFSVGGVLGGTKLRTGAGTKQVEITRHQMLEIVVVAIEPDLDIVFMEQRQDIFNELRGVAMFAAGINGMMPDDDFPAGL